MTTNPLCKPLIDLAEVFHGVFHYEREALLRNAAAELESLTARVKELEAEADQKHAKAVELCDKLIAERQRAKELESDNEALLEYACHKPTCPMPANACDCGLLELLEN